LCLLSNGATPQSITWVLPRDPWLLNRAHFQPGLDDFGQSIGGVASQFEAFASASSVRELWMRLGWLQVLPPSTRGEDTVFDGRRLVLCVPVRLRSAEDLVQNRRGVVPGGQSEREHQLIGLRPCP
jgi:hypothetical protein